MRIVLVILAAIAAICMWACGIGFAVSVIAAVLKACNVTLVAGMSYWLPVKFIGGWIISVCVAGAAVVGSGLK